MLLLAAVRVLRSRSDPVRAPRSALAVLADAGPAARHRHRHGDAAHFPLSIATAHNAGAAAAAAVGRGTEPLTASGMEARVSAPADAVADSAAAVDGSRQASWRAQRQQQGAQGHLARLLRAHQAARGRAHRADRRGRHAARHARSPPTQRAVDLREPRHRAGGGLRRGLQPRARPPHRRLHGAHPRPPAADRHTGSHRTGDRLCHRARHALRCWCCCCWSTRSRPCSLSPR